MKRFFLILGLVLAAGLVFSNIELSAQDGTKAGSPTMQAQRSANFVDENGNGICDRFENGTPMRMGGQYVNGHGSNFVDENGDGICDRAGTGMQQHGNRGGGHSRMGNGSRCGR